MVINARIIDLFIDLLGESASQWVILRMVSFIATAEEQMLKVEALTIVAVALVDLIL